MKIRNLLIAMAAASTVILSSVTLPGCAALGLQQPGAAAKLSPTQGNKATGTVTFTQHGDKVVVDADITGLAPGEHGFHIHEKGDCSAPDGTSAGGHFNPNGQPHGDPAQPHHHFGDMPMLTADAGGHAKLHVELTSITLQEGAGNIIGKSVIVHQKADDYQTQPTGNSGGRVACGVIAAK
ncbi:MAG TPA: superoxide dismutase family protein [Spongiibacteraceae bacterium]|nr:superoxide dismutase family protein [Spongiibacteraceae bacterium]